MLQFENQLSIFESLSDPPCASDDLPCHLDWVEQQIRFLNSELTKGLPAEEQQRKMRALWAALEREAELHNLIAEQELNPLPAEPLLEPDAAPASDNQEILADADVQQGFEIDGYDLSDDIDARSYLHNTSRNRPDDFTAALEMVIKARPSNLQALWEWALDQCSLLLEPLEEARLKTLYKEARAQAQASEPTTAQVEPAAVAEPDPNRPSLLPLADLKWRCGYCGEQTKLVSADEDRIVLKCAKYRDHSGEVGRFAVSWKRGLSRTGGSLIDMLELQFENHGRYARGLNRADALRLAHDIRISGWRSEGDSEELSQALADKEAFEARLLAEQQAAEGLEAETVKKDVELYRQELARLDEQIASEEFQQKSPEAQASELRSREHLAGYLQETEAAGREHEGFKPEPGSYLEGAIKNTHESLPLCPFCNSGLFVTMDPHQDAKGHQAWSLYCLKKGSKHSVYIDTLPNKKGVLVYGFDFLTHTKGAHHTKKTIKVTAEQMDAWRELLPKIFYPSKQEEQAPAPQATPFDPEELRAKVTALYDALYAKPGVSPERWTEITAELKQIRGLIVADIEELKLKIAGAQERRKLSDEASKEIPQKIVALREQMEEIMHGGYSEAADLEAGRLQRQVDELIERREEIEERLTAGNEMGSDAHILPAWGQWEKRLNEILELFPEFAEKPSPDPDPPAKTKKARKPRAKKPQAPTLEDLVEQGADIPAIVGTCRECGCTDHDCTACIEEVGFPCYWEESDLCSRCHQKALKSIGLQEPSCRYCEGKMRLLDPSDNTWVCTTDDYHRFGITNGNAWWRGRGTFEANVEIPEFAKSQTNEVTL